MKLKLIKIFATLFLYFLPFIPEYWFHEMLYKNESTSELTTIGHAYIYLLSIILLCSWGLAAQKIASKIVDKFSKKEDEKYVCLKIE